MFTKKILWLFMALFLYSSHTAIALSDEQREILYTLYEMDQDFASIQMIVENIDMFIGVISMEIQLLERKLMTIEQELNWTLLNTAAWIGIGAVGKVAFIKGIKSLPNLNNDVESVLNAMGMNVFGLLSMYTGLNMYDVFKEKNRIKKDLALNKAVLEKLEEVKYSTNQNTVEPISSQLLDMPAHKTE